MLGMGGLLKQVQEMQKRLAAIQEELEALRVEGISGGGMVKAQVNGKLQLLDLTIHPSIIDPADPEVLEDLVVLAVAEAQKKAAETAKAKLQDAAGGLPIPPIPGLTA